MEVSRHQFYLFDLDEHASLLSFIWTEKSAAMSDDDYKAAITAFARLVVKHRARRALIDLRKFRFHLADAAGLGSWWADEIVPLYHQAGLEKFVFVLPAGEPVPPDETPANATTGEKFLTKHFGSEPAAIAWLTAAA
ncbi:MAG TPA: hypothetical protein VIY51_17920 [Xanthobacteraceae bacterium]